VIDASELAAPPEKSPFPDRTLAVAYADGASRGNPGAAAYGVVYTLEDGTALCGEGGTLGKTTNNVAEYNGLLAALRRLRSWGIANAIVRLDSELVVRQMQGRYKVKNLGLKPLYQQAKELADEFNKLRLEHVPRKENALADAMANLALDR
jgi:ribonuclease HI